ncbi:hypothetical protein Nmel_012072 [Mimus melanotis]
MAAPGSLDVPKAGLDGAWRGDTPHLSGGPCAGATIPCPCPHRCALCAQPCPGGIPATRVPTSCSTCSTGTSSPTTPSWITTSTRRQRYRQPWLCPSLRTEADPSPCLNSGIPPTAALFPAANPTLFKKVEPLQLSQ